MNELNSPFVPQTRGQDASWFAVYTMCRHEKRVAEHLVQRDIPHFLPLFRSRRKWRDGSKVILDLPLFPCYLFVQVSKSERVRVLNVPGALALVGGTGGEPAPVPAFIIESLRLGLQLRKVEPHPLLTVGQQVRIRSGAFAGMQGVITRLKNEMRVVLTLEQILQSISVEVDADDVELLERSAPFSFSLAAVPA